MQAEMYCKLFVCVCVCVMNNTSKHQQGQRHWAAICLADTALNKRIDQELDNDSIRKAAASLEADPPPATGSKTSVVA